MTIHSLTPELVTLEGEAYDTYELAEMMGLDEEDARFLGRCGRLSADEYRYLNAKYPEYMGFWAQIVKGVVTAIPKGVKAIAKAVKKKKAKKKEAAAAKTAAQKAAEEKAAYEQQLLLQQQQAAAQQKKMMMMIGIPAAALLLLMMMRR